MRGVVFLGDRQLELMEFPDPTPGEGEVVLEMKASGMCGSDLHQYRRHEGGESIGGLPVAAEPGHRRPRAVRHRRRGRSRRSPRGQAKIGTTGHGAPLQGLHRVQSIADPAGRSCARKCRSRCTATTPMAGTPRYLKVPAFTLVPLLDELSFTSGRGDFVRHRHRLWRAAPHSALGQRHDGHSFAQGPLGLSATQLAKGDGVAGHRARCQRGSGSTAPRNSAPTKSSTRARIDPVARDQGFDARLRRRIHARHVIASPEGRISAVRATKVWGTTCFVGERNNVTIDVSPDMLRKQLTIVASWTFSQMGQAECAQFIADRGIDVEKLFTAPLAARPGRRGLQTVRHADDR